MDRYLAKKIVDTWMQYAEDEVARIRPRPHCLPPLPPKDLGLALIGVRRCGKTSEALLLATQSFKGEYLYINFEDPVFLEFDHHSVLDLLLEVFTEYRGTYPKLVIYDEIQNIKGWERWARKHIDMKRSHLLVTGSSAKMLGHDIATSLTGRVLTKKVWPLSFREFLDFRGMMPKLQEGYLAALREYSEFGGFPLVVLSSDSSLKKNLLRQYYSDILLKDVAIRNEIRDLVSLEKIAYHYFSNISSHHSYSALKKAYHLGSETPAQYSRCLKDAFLIFEVERFHKNLKVQTRDSKKIYAIDSGLRNYNSKSLSKDDGKVIENIVYLELLRRGKQIYYFKEDLETDFLVIEGVDPTECYQVCDSDLTDEKTYDREVNGMLNSLEATRLDEGTILTRSRAEVKKISGKKIRFEPVYQWLLGS